MAVILYRQRTLRRASRLRDLAVVPRLDAGGCLRGAGDRARAPSPASGSGGYGGFLVWAGWYLAITVAMLYVVNTARQVPTQRIVRLLGWMFVVTTGFGVLAVLVPTLEFKSAMELVLPKGLTSSNYVRTLVHPSLSSTSDFLGYVQAATDGPVPLLQRLGQQPRDVPAVLRPGLVRPRRRLAPDGGPVRAGRRPWSPSPSRSTADCGARSRWRPGTPPSGSR